MRILVATRNAGKLREYAELLADLAVGGQPITWVSLADLDIQTEIDETGTTFEENARLKAAGYAQASGLITLADDSGLVVDALDGAPGVQSARYGGPGASVPDQHRLLLRELEGIPLEQRTARFVCVVAACTPEGKTVTAEGACEGLIAFERRGSGGFGYDPLFYLPDREQTMAELPPGVKNQISHRAVALDRLKPDLARLLNERH